MIEGGLHPSLNDGLYRRRAPGTYNVKFITRLTESECGIRRSDSADSPA